MREIIKFRGKDEKTGEWRYGWFVGYSKHSSYIYGDYVDKDEVWHVLTNTVGQFTGLFDKNGKEIYEGDVVSAWSTGVKTIGEVKQRNDGMWFIYPPLWHFNPNSKGRDDVEIIGNIYENPELLKEATL